MDFPDLVNRACDAFRQQVGNQAGLLSWPVTDESPHPMLVFRPKGDKADCIYTALDVPLVDATTIKRLIQDWDSTTKKIVIANFVPADLAYQLKAEGIPFLDAAGNAYIDEPGFFLFIACCPPPAGLEISAPTRRPRLFKPAGLKVLFVLLARPAYVNSPYRGIAKAAGVALGSVAGLMGDMKELGYLVPGKDGRRLQQRKKLIGEWANAYVHELVPRREARRFHAENTEWWKTTDPRQFNALWGGNVAAERLTGNLKPGEVMVYVDGNPGPLLQAQRMQADPQGDVAVIKKFWHFPPTDSEGDIVPPLLIYADLMATGDPRAIETAGLIHECQLARPDGTA